MLNILNQNQITNALVAASTRCFLLNKVELQPQIWARLNGNERQFQGRSLSFSSLLLSPRNASMSVTRRVPTKAWCLELTICNQRHLREHKLNRAMAQSGNSRELDTERHERRHNSRHDTVYPRYVLQALCITCGSPCHLCVVAANTSLNGAKTAN